MSLHPKMMGKGADGGCGTQEKPCPLNRPPSRTPTNSNQTLEPVVAVDLYAHARKALSDRSPFDTSEEVLSRVPTLPAKLSDVLSRPSGDSRRRKHKKSHSVPGAQGSGRSVWAETEEYFRPVTLVDIENLASKSVIGSASDSCFTIPLLPLDRVVDLHVVSADTASRKNAVQIGGLEQATVFEEQKNEGQEMEIDSRVDADEVPPKEQEDDNSSSFVLSSSSSDLHWLLGSKHKVLLTSERPSKKRKLLGEDAGLEKLVSVHPSQREDLTTCHVCCSADSGDQSNRFILCRSCNVTVHQNCYGVRDFPVGKWLCSWCKQHDCLEAVSTHKPVELSSKSCLLCPKEGGALKPVSADVGGSGNGGSVKFAHLFCSLWMPEVYVENTEMMEPIVNMGSIAETRRKLVCNLCKVKYGVCIRCSHGTCRTSFHPICARLARHRMEIWGKAGCDNVELRAFCSKHSVSQDAGNASQSDGAIGNIQLLEGPTSTISGGDSSVAKPLPVTVSANRLRKIKLGGRNRENSTVNEKAPEQPDEASTKKSPSELDAPPVRSNVGLISEDNNALPIKNEERSRVTERGSIADIDPPSSLNLLLILKKLIDQGKANASHAASEMGISSDLLASILADDHASLSAELQLKVIKWLQSSAHMATSTQCLKLRNNSSVQIDANVAGDVVPNAVKEADPHGLVMIPTKTLPPRRRSKNNARNSKDKKMVGTYGITLEQQNGNGMPVDEISRLPFVNDDMKKDGACNGSLFHKQDHFCKEKIPTASSELVASDPSPVGLMLGQEGIPVEMSNNVPEMEPEPQTMVEKVLSLQSEKHEADETDVKSSEEHVGHAVGSGFQNMPDIKNEESARSYIHPFISKRMMQAHKCVCLKQENRLPIDDGQRKKCTPHMEATRTVCTCHHYQLGNSTCDDLNCTSDATGGEQVVKDRKREIFLLSPEDEVEGEIIYFQNRLLDNAVASKHRCEDLILRVVTNLPHELDALRKQRWDAVLANQFLCDVREAKKQGRKERRHREAQAVLAAAAAAAASSSRISSFRRDVHDEVVATPYEVNPVKVNTVSGRSPRAKETLSRMAVPKSEQFEIFQLTSDFSKEQPRSCDICRRTETLLNPILVCCSCKVSVHLSCYRNHKATAGPWYCELCEELLSQSRSPINPSLNARERSSFVGQCGLCGGTTGAFRKSIGGQWVHAFCAEWVLQSTFRRGQSNPVDGMDTVASEKDLLICCICCRKLGVCIKCSYGNCQSAFHPSCAKNAGFYMSIKTAGGKVQHKAYCEKHSVEQREKAETQHHGAEDLQSIRQIRVELEKVRLLCERIIKREKLKRELVLCSHDILASKRDTVAFSMLARSSFLPPDVSSESVTTSLKGHTDDNKSCSEAFQRSDDTTVDSTVSGKRRATIPPHMNMDRKTDDSSTSQWPFTRKPTERVPFSGKQLPLRPPAVASRTPADDGGKRSKSRKHTETFRKELVMTSDQAMTYNLMLPKGYAYVPRTCLPTEKPAIGNTESRDTDPHEPSDPDG